MTNKTDSKIGACAVSARVAWEALCAFSVQVRRFSLNALGDIRLCRGAERVARLRRFNDDVGRLAAQLERLLDLSRSVTVMQSENFGVVESRLAEIRCILAGWRAELALLN